MRKLTNCVGQTQKMKCGLNATIIEYHNSKNIDIQFEDGIIVKHKYYNNFKEGTIKHPKYNAIAVKYSNKYINETKKMNCGLNATIITYRKSTDIDIQFEDGIIITHKQYSQFQDGKIKHPKYNTNIIKCTNKYIGQTNKMICGLNATIIAYRENTDIDVQFEDGIVVTNKTINNFKNGRIFHPSNKIDHTGETKKMNCGLNATIIAYRKSTDIDIQFEDGIIIPNKQYSSFIRGYISHPKYNTTTNKYTNRRIGETRKMMCGLNATIIAYRKSDDIDIQFEDGVIITNTNCSQFENNMIKHPSISTVVNVFKNKRIGETHKMKCGLNGTIINYQNCNDITVQLETGTIIHTSYDTFKKRQVSEHMRNNFIIGKIYTDVNNVPIIIKNIMPKKIDEKQRTYCCQYADNVKIYSTTDHLRHEHHPKMPKINYKLKNYKVDEHLTIVKQINTNECKKSLYYICIFDNEEQIWAKNKITKYFKNIYHLDFQKENP